MQQLRAYQSRTVAAAISALDQHGRVCVVMPTGAGKTVTGAQIAAGYDALWLVHTTALREQTPGRVVTVQSLLGGERPECELLVADECHHLSGSAHAWKAVARDYPRVLGLTATPCRGDGAPLGELFNHLIVGATYSELLKSGYLVPCRVVRPTEVPEETGLSDEPARAWQRWAGDRRGFAFFGRVELAARFARAIGHGAAVVHGEQKPEHRAEVMRRFRAGELRVLASVSTLTEGVDVPNAEVCMLARGVSHEGAYLQAVGRVLRPSQGKRQALLIDLPGASFRYGLPTDDRRYSLDGVPVSRAGGEPALSQCQACGSCYPSKPACPDCGFVAPRKPPKVRVWGVPLEDVGDELTPEQRSKVDWRARMEADPAARRAWFESRLARESNPRRAAAVYRGIFGRWPTAKDGWTWQR